MYSFKGHIWNFSTFLAHILTPIEMGHIQVSTSKHKKWLWFLPLCEIKTYPLLSVVKEIRQNNCPAAVIESLQFTTYCPNWHCSWGLVSRYFPIDCATARTGWFVLKVLLNALFAKYMPTFLKLFWICQAIHAKGTICFFF